MKKIKKKRIFIGILTSIILILILWGLYKKGRPVHNIEQEFKVADSVSVDTVEIPEEWLSKEFSREMMKGVNGDFTLEQVDSMRKSWAKFDSIEASKR